LEKEPAAIKGPGHKEKRGREFTIKVITQQNCGGEKNLTKEEACRRNREKEKRKERGGNQSRDDESQGRARPSQN